MAFTPDQPSPKNPGDSIRSKDWNDLVTETKRLDTAKVERAGDAITGPLSIAGALAIGKSSASATSKLDVAGDLRINDSNLYLRGGTDGNHGLGWFGNPTKLWGAVNVDGPVLWGNAGGALGTAAGGAQKIALGWDNNGNISIGVPSTTLKVDIGDRIRLRQKSASFSNSDTAGLWLYQNTPGEDKAFVGMVDDAAVGFYGNKGAGWGLSMDVATGTVGVRVGTVASYGMYLNAGAVGANAALPYGLVITGATSYGLYVTNNAYVGGRLRDSKVRTWIQMTNAVNTTSTSYVDMPNMSLTVVSPDIGAYFQIIAQINGVQAQNSTTIGAYFRLLVDGNQQDATRNEFNHNGWELRGISLGRIVYLAPGSHTISLQWATTAGALLTCCWYNDSRQIMVVEL